MTDASLECAALSALWPAAARRRDVTKDATDIKGPLRPNEAATGRSGPKRRQPGPAAAARGGVAAHSKDAYFTASKDGLVY